MDKEAKLDTSLDIIEKKMYILDRRLDRYEADTNYDYPEQPISSPSQKKNQPLQDKNNKQNGYDERDYE